MSLEFTPRDLRIVSAGDGMKDSAFIEATDNVDNLRADAHTHVFEEDTVPNGAVQIPDQTLDRSAIAAPLTVELGHSA
jgi:hypothetical protein